MSYESLKNVLDRAFEQASHGKGKERHAEADEPFERQIICEVTRRAGLGYPLGQAVKKVYESQRLGGDRGIAELLGAINYIAAAVIVMGECHNPHNITGVVHWHEERGKPAPADSVGCDDGHSIYGGEQQARNCSTCGTLNRCYQSNERKCKAFEHWVPKQEQARDCSTCREHPCSVMRELYCKRHDFSEWRPK